MFSKVEFELYFENRSNLFALIDQYMLEHRLGMHRIKFENKDLIELSYFSSAVLGAIATEDIDFDDWRKILKVSADIEYILFEINYELNRQESMKNHIMRAAILYESAEYYGITALLGNKLHTGKYMQGFLSRNTDVGFGKLGVNIEDKNQIMLDESHSIIERGIEEIIYKLACYMQNFNQDDLSYAENGIKLIKEIVCYYNFDWNADEIVCLTKLINRRGRASISKFVPSEILYDLKVAKTPSELWKSQIAAINGGLFNENIDSLGIATPTGTGKTALAQILLISFFKTHRGKKAFYIVPSKALAAQVSNDLAKVLLPLGYNIAALGSHLTFSKEVSGDPKDADLLIFTPEKADLILRIEHEILKDVGMVIVDEAHHIESGTRGILLEFYLWRIKRMVPHECRIVQLSAVAPNINELVEWLSRDKISSSIKMDWRPGKFRIGIYEKDNEIGLLKFGNAQAIQFKNYNFQLDDAKYDINIINIGNLAHSLSKDGIVLVLSVSKSKSEKIAEYIKALRYDFLKQDKQSELSYNMESLDAKLERELYAEVPLRNSISFGVAYHHSGLPSRVRFAVEEVIKEKKVNIVCATTTLAEGVNFPFSTVIIESLIIGRNTQLSPRELWNIAGRAGRFGVDVEGHCILYAPSLYISKLSGYQLKDYLDIQLDSIPPVKSALAEAFTVLDNALSNNLIAPEDLLDISLGKIKKSVKGEMGKLIVGMINMYRVGLTHAYANNLISIDDDSNDSITQEMLAYQGISEHTKKVVKSVETGQRTMLKNSLFKNKELLNIAAKVGWSIESQNNLFNWIISLKDWQIENMGKIIDYSGRVKEDQLKWLLYPVAENMIEFEGNKLGGFTSYIAENWIKGYSITEIKKSSGKDNRKEYEYSRLVDIIYSRIQYLLPWALYGVSDLLNYEASKRGINLGTGVRDLSILSSEGVPNFNALTLCMHMDVERVDATRLSEVFISQGKGKDILIWFKQLRWYEIEKIVKGNDSRRIDPDLKLNYEKL